MTKAFSCDRCRQFEGGDPVLKLTLTADTGVGRIQNKELCSTCLADLHDWLLLPTADADQPVEAESP